MISTSLPTHCASSPGEPAVSIIKPSGDLIDLNVDRIEKHKNAQDVPRVRIRGAGEDGVETDEEARKRQEEEGALENPTPDGRRVGPLGS